MKGKYITLQIRMACQTKPVRKDIHAELEQTIAERKRILHQLEKYSQAARIVEMIITNTKAA